MTITISDSTKNPQVASIGRGASHTTPFSAITVSDDTDASSTPLTVTITLAAAGSLAAPSDLGMLNTTDTDGSVFTAQVAASHVTAFLQSLQYTPVDFPIPGNTSYEVGATVAVSNGSTTMHDDTLVVIDVQSAIQFSGLVANQSFVGNGPFSPFEGVNIEDTSFNNTALDSFNLVITSGGQWGTFTGYGAYTAANTYSDLNQSPPNLAAILADTHFNPTVPAGQTQTISFEIDLIDDARDGKTVTTRALDSITVTGAGAPPPPPGSNFQVVDETTGQAYQTAGTSYTGPVAGITSEFITVTPDNVNVNALVPNVFIHSGSGQDGLTALSGTNILDGSTNSNFLTGGSGQDTFYLDDRNPAQPIFSTVVSFHSGDDVTVFGVTKADFSLVVLPNEGAPGFTGVDLLYHANSGNQPDVSFVLAGYTAADLTNGKTSMVYSTEADGTPFMTLHAT